LHPQRHSAERSTSEGKEGWFLRPTGWTGSGHLRERSSGTEAQPEHPALGQTGLSLLAEMIKIQWL